MVDQADRLRDIVKTKAEEQQNSPQMSARVISVTSGKGGVGKTNFTVNLAIQLSKMGKRVLIIDTDFGLANIEVLFGIIPKYSFADVVMGDKTIEEVVTDGPMGIKFISGGSGLGEMANLTEKQVRYILDSFYYLDTIADIILIDTGAGINKTVVSFIRASGETIIVTTPEPTSITDAYAIIKTVSDSNNNGISPHFKILINRADDAKEAKDIFERLNKVAHQFLNIDLQSLGYLPYDNNLVKAVKKQEPVVISFPNSEVSRALSDIGLRLMNVTVKERNSDGIKGFMRRFINIFND